MPAPTANNQPSNQASGAGDSTPPNSGPGKDFGSLPESWARTRRAYVCDECRRQHRSCHYVPNVARKCDRCLLSTKVPSPACGAGDEWDRQQANQRAIAQAKQRYTNGYQHTEDSAQRGRPSNEVKQAALLPRVGQVVSSAVGVGGGNGGGGVTAGVTGNSGELGSFGLVGGYGRATEGSHGNEDNTNKDNQSGDVEKNDETDEVGSDEREESDNDE
ncbi:hypothetical protein B0O99DRAFT_687093 [Bisporella sp. PMI_857]|nr:hypothetical protein B0O99DRAFT_687093 [Bisporella sp. PMI_857]